MSKMLIHGTMWPLPKVEEKYNASAQVYNQWMSLFSSSSQGWMVLSEHDLQSFMTRTVTDQNNCGKWADFQSRKGTDKPFL